MNKLVLAASSALALVAAAPASALTFTFSIGGEATGAGTLLTDDVADADGGYLVTGITGVLDGVSITGLSTPGGRGNNDNLLFPGGPTLVDGSGISFFTGAQERNLFFNDSIGAYRLLGEATVLFAVTQLPSAAVPEPATWGLMLAGFGLMGAGLRARRRRTTVTYA